MPSIFHHHGHGMTPNIFPTTAVLPNAPLLPPHQDSMFGMFNLGEPIPGQLGAGAFGQGQDPNNGWPLMSSTESQEWTAAEPGE